MPTYSPQGYNAILTWETTNTYNAGLDLGFLDNRLTATVDVYERRATDLLARVNFSAGSNLTNQLDANIGSLRNRGIEVGLNYGILRGADLNWDVNLNGAYNVNKITDLGQQPPGFPATKWVALAAAPASPFSIRRWASPSTRFFVASRCTAPMAGPWKACTWTRTATASSTTPTTFLQAARAARDAGLQLEPDVQEAGFGLHAAQQPGQLRI